MQPVRRGSWGPTRPTVERSARGPGSWGEWGDLCPGPGLPERLVRVPQPFLPLESAPSPAAIEPPDERSGFQWQREGHSPSERGRRTRRPVRLFGSMAPVGRMACRITLYDPVAQIPKECKTKGIRATSLLALRSECRLDEMRYLQSKGRWSKDASNPNLERTFGSLRGDSIITQSQTRVNTD